MSRVSSFYGITVIMFFHEGRHDGLPHFHAEFGSQKASFKIEHPQLLAGSLSPRANRLVIEWARAHEQELLVNWERVREYLTPLPIQPLD
ncbi:MAG TPA: DUF4160 domain-containing protein [Solirubrobacterales bacterium]|jgi:hypothetical protein|nr:DUF4160 domain-containing protein [Solirubrobacterales bacterium]